MASPFHPRADWGARPPLSVTRRTLGQDTAHYGGPSPWGAVDRSSAARFQAATDHSRCASIVRAYQAYHMDTKGWQDIAYSSLVCPHGHRYEGRGLDVRTAANGTTAGNDASHATCYIAGDDDPLTGPAKAAFFDEGSRLRLVLKGHRDWKPTSCPGDELYVWVHSDQRIPDLEDDMTPDEVKTAMREVLNEGTAFGQVSWAGTSKDTLATAQSLVTKGDANTARILAAVGAVDDAVLAGLSDSLADRIADLVVDQLPAGTVNVGDLRAGIRADVHAEIRGAFTDAGTPDDGGG